jgi:hypothetical protein
MRSNLWADASTTSQLRGFITPSFNEVLSRSLIVWFAYLVVVEVEAEALGCDSKYVNSQELIFEWCTTDRMTVLTLTQKKKQKTEDRRAAKMAKNGRRFWKHQSLEDGSRT